MTFNTMHIIDKCRFSDLLELKKLMKQHKLGSKTSGYFGLFFTPLKIDKAKLVIANSRKNSENNSKRRTVQQ